MISYLNKNKLPGVIAIVDYTKCFDRLEYGSIRSMLSYLNYGEEFIKLVFLLFNCFQVCTSNNGHLSQLFNKERGVNQGCPASPAIYIQTGSVISHLIQLDSNIKGISFCNLKNLLSQFADDTTAFLKYEQLTINGFCEVLSKIKNNLGLSVSYEKTTLYRVGSLANSEAQCYTVKPLKWSNGPIETLGLKFECDSATGNCTENFEKIIRKVDKVCAAWMNRSLPLIGKILVINTLMASLFVYDLAVIINLNHEEIKIVKQKTHSFLWNGKCTGRISMNTLTKPKLEGGWKLVNIKAKQDSLKIQSIFKSGELLNCLYSKLGITDVRPPSMEV